MKKLMKKYFVISLLAILFFGLVFWRVKKTIAPTSVNDQTQPTAVSDNTYVSEPAADPLVQKIAEFQTPLDRAKERVTKKPFGISITSANSPVQPERFSGYHTGTDFEIFPEELSAEITVRAICDGKLMLKKIASGYGGVAVQACTLDNQPVTVVYGHLKLVSIAKNTGDDLKMGDTIGKLGVAYSLETDGERKHLHLGIHKGSGVNILGYVQTKSALSDWVDPCLYVCE